MNRTRAITRAGPLQISVFEPHHEVNPVFPSPSILERGEGFLAMIPFRLADRCDPTLPLIPDTVVRASSRQNVDETAMQSIYPAPLDCVPSTSELNGNLMHDMHRVCQSRGRTTLKACVYSATTPAGQERIRIVRETSYALIGGAFHDDVASEYDYSLLDFQGLLAGRIARFAGVHDMGELDCPTWLQQLADLIDQYTDRGAQAWRFQIEKTTQAHRVPALNWRKPRTIDVSAGIRMISTPATREQIQERNDSLPNDESQTECHFCMVAFNDDDEPVVIFKCPKRHVVHHECWKQWLDSRGLGNVKCLYCQVPLITSDNPALRPNYLDINATFRNDPRYTRFENFERSYADLDRHDAQNNTTLVIINKNAMNWMWEHIYNTPRTLAPNQYATFPEHAIVTDTVQRTLADFHGQQVAVDVLYRALRKAVFGALRFKFWTSGLDPYQTPTARHALGLDAELVPLRRGFKREFERALNRVMMFLVLRDCEKAVGNDVWEMVLEWCTLEENRNVGLSVLYRRGDRLYYMMNLRSGPEYDSE